MSPHAATEETSEVSSIPTLPKDYKWQLHWANILFFGSVHVFAVIGLYLSLYTKWQTLLWSYLLLQVSILGVSAGVHRLWTHKAYKAKWPLQIFLAICYTIGHQKSILKWARDHRVHHRYTETDADPHNIKRGVFFAHFGWLFFKKLPLLMEKGKLEDLSDLTSNPLVMFHHNHYYKIMPFLSWVMPTLVPMYYWDETFVNSFCVATGLRYCLTLHFTFLINSWAHAFGNRPYDKRIRSYKERMYQFRNGGARHGAPLDLAVKKASSGPAHNVALSLNRNQRRSPQDRGRRNTRPHLGNGDQRYGPKYRSRRSYYVRRRQPRRELRSSARLRLNPWAPLNEGSHVLGELMRQVHDFMRLFSSIPAVYQKPPALPTPPIGYQTATRTAQYSLKNEDSSRRYPEKLIISPAQRTAQYSLKNEDSSRRYPEKLIISPAQRSVGTATSQQYSVKTEDTSRRPQAKALPPQPTQRTPGVRMTPYLLPTTRTDVRWRIYPGVGNTARYEENRFNNGPSYPTYKR